MPDRPHGISQVRISSDLPPYNRARLLEQTLAALSAAASPPDCEVDVVVIDNNSTDETMSVIARAAQHSRWPIRSALERSQGKSFALNRGLTLARGDVLALTDDDVLPADDWLVRMVDRFRTPDIVFVFGKVLPRWEVPPPPELLTTVARDIWGPLALVDYGDDVVRYDAESFGVRRLPIGANLAIRRDAIERVGGWRTDLGKVDNSLIAGEDHELCVRLYRAGLYIRHLTIPTWPSGTSYPPRDCDAPTSAAGSTGTVEQWREWMMRCTSNSIWSASLVSRASPIRLSRASAAVSVAGCAGPGGPTRWRC